ncbi:hypothetical protein [Aureimonas pseudogalii]|uniref:Uncharacterized protein n=1 Tax=Aureimonas pseudogalii TaxID=1744844 RepID=A0A7W6H3I8_9HYPH|nr:hypothetical protein [Aureimonas pseudogalii]MBB3997217.1 hypothetical protein [Aureimonas pseudogalii]
MSEAAVFENHHGMIKPKSRRPRNIKANPEFQVDLNVLLAQRRTTIAYVRSPISTRVMKEIRLEVAGLCRKHGMGWRQTGEFIWRDPGAVRRMVEKANG